MSNVIDKSKCKLASKGKFDNAKIRNLYSQLQLLKMDFEAVLRTKENKSQKASAEGTEVPSLTIDVVDGGKTKEDAIKEKISSIQAMSAFLKINRKKKGVLMFVDSILRFVSFALWLIISSTILSPISILFKPIDDLLANMKVIPPQYKLSTIIKRLVGAVACIVSGVQVSSEGLIDKNTGKALFGEKSYVMCFSHASNLDVFVLAATTPIFHPCPGKADLYLIPFFSWILYACGVIPIHRTDQGQAIKVLDKVAGDMQKSGSGDCIAIAPEGTRSKSGLILDFKSGPFYQAEGVNLPIIPAVVIGASDLWPATGTIINSTGKVFVRYLQPIDQGTRGASEDPKDPARVANRANVSKKVRQEMLTTLLTTESDKNTDIDFGFRMLMYLTDCIVLFMSHCIYITVKNLLLVRFGLSNISAVILCIVAPLAVTAMLYIFVSFQISRMSEKNKDKKS